MATNPSHTNSTDGFREGPKQASELDKASPPEWWMEQVWQLQSIRRDRLRTTDGVAVRILHPGFLNRQAGPDFLRAVVQFDEAVPVTGDVELDVSDRGWTQHRHAVNRDYDQVVLRVVWSPRSGKPGSSEESWPPGETLSTGSREFRASGIIRAGSEIPVLEMRRFVEDSILSERPWLSSRVDWAQPILQAGRCRSALARVEPNVVAALVRQAAGFRLRQKAERIALRAQTTGWAQALWEALFCGLGYRNNTWPMRNLAEVFYVAWGDPSLWPLEEDVVPWKARLFGLAGFLPDQLPGGRGRSEVRRLWDFWWRERDAWLIWTLPRSLWNTQALRPNNHPQRRLVLAAHWLTQGNVVPRLEQWLLQSDSPRTAVQNLKDVLTPPSDPFWETHCTLDGKPMLRPQALLGKARLTDVVINGVLPWMWARAESGSREALRQRVEARYFSWPSGEPNIRLRLTCQRLCLERPKGHALGGAAWQQGLLQIQHSFCNQTDALCSDCEFPDLLNSMHTGNEAGAERPLASGSPGTQPE